MRYPHKSLALILIALGGAFAQNQTPSFVDVPPCHWAAGAVGRLASPETAARPERSALLALNAVQQVFEGLKCGDTRWSARFIDRPSSAFVAALKIGNFELRNAQAQISGDNATVRFSLVVDLGERTVRRDATARLVFGGEGWKVAYDSLVALDLPVFPR